MGLPTLVIVASCFLKVGDGREVRVPFFDSVVPESCGLYRHFRIDCPGCGMTRSFIRISDGRFSEATRLHPFSLPVYGFVVAQIILGGWSWLRSMGVASDSNALHLAIRANQPILLCLMIGMFLWWAAKLVPKLGALM